MGANHLTRDEKITSSARLRDRLVMVCIGVLVLFLIVGGFLGLSAVQEIQRTGKTVEGQTKSIDQNAQAAREAADSAASLASANKATLDALNEFLQSAEPQRQALTQAILDKISEGNAQHEAIINAKLDAILAEVTIGNEKAVALGDELLAQVIASNEKATESNERAAEAQRIAIEGNAADRAIADELARQAAVDNAISQARIAELLGKIQQLLDERLPRDICTTCVTTTTIPPA